MSRGGMSQRDGPRAKLPLPDGKTDAGLGGISCTSATMCMAVGEASDGASNRDLLAEQWDGTAWTIKTVPSLRERRV